MHCVITFAYTISANVFEQFQAGNTKLYPNVNIRKEKNKNKTNITKVLANP